MARAVLDASAVLAVINGEPGAQAVAKVVGDAAVSTVTMAEILSKLVEWEMQIDQARQTVDIFDFEIPAFDRPQADLAGYFRAVTRRQGLSLADRACLALAARLAVPAYTADQAWGGLGIGVDIELIR